MSKKLNNNLFKVTNEETKYVHYFTSFNRMAAILGCKRTSLEVAFLKNQAWHDYNIEIVDGTNIMYKDIN